MFSMLLYNAVFFDYYLHILSYFYRYWQYILINGSWIESLVSYYLRCICCSLLFHHASSWMSLVLSIFPCVHMKCNLSSMVKRGYTHTVWRISYIKHLLNIWNSWNKWMAKYQSQIKMFQFWKQKLKELKELKEF